MRKSSTTYSHFAAFPYIVAFIFYDCLLVLCVYGPRLR